MENIEEQIENKIIDCIVSSSGGRLIVTKPESSKTTIDLVIEKRGGYKAGKLLLEVSGFAIPAESKNFVKDFVKNDFKPDKNYYLLFVCFDEIKQILNDKIWLVPSVTFKDICEQAKTAEGEDVLKFSAPLDFKIEDKYSKFLINKNNLGIFLIEALK